MKFLQRLFVILILVLGAVIVTVTSNVYAATQVQVSHQQTVKHFGRVTENTKGQLYNFSDRTQHSLQRSYSLAKFPRTTWVIRQTADFKFNRHQASKYYYVISTSSLTRKHYSGWVWHGYLKKPQRVLLHAPYVSQQAVKAWMGCESASLLEGLHYKNVLTKTGLVQFMKQLPISPNNNPNNGFAGSPYRVTPGVFQSIFPQPLAKWGNKYHTVRNISGFSAAKLKNQLRLHNPVVVYVTLHFKKAQFGHYFWGQGINNSHVMLLDGYRPGAYHVADPNHGRYWVSAHRFTRSYNYRHYAVAIQ